MSGVFLLALTQAKTSMQVNGLVSIASFWENTFYGVRSQFHSNNHTSQITISTQPN
jgi:hypothetical protein